MESSSQCRTASTDIPDPLSPLLPIVHRFWQVFRTTSRILTQLLCVCSSWSSCFCLAICGDSQEYVTDELVLASPAVSCMSGASNLDSYVLRTSIDKIRENGFEVRKKRSRRYPAKTITDADYADDRAIQANTPNQAETLLHSLERVATGIGLHVKAHRTKYMCYNQTGEISTLDGTSPKLLDKFTYLGSSISSTKKDIDTRLTKA